MRVDSAPDKFRDNFHQPDGPSHGRRGAARAFSLLAGGQSSRVLSVAGWVRTCPPRARCGRRVTVYPIIGGG